MPGSVRSVRAQTGGDIMRIIFAMLIAASLAPVFTLASTTDAGAQPACRAKCTDEESACMKRTNNKSQCGNTAKTCAGKCK